VTVDNSTFNLTGLKVPELIKEILGLGTMVADLGPGIFGNQFTHNSPKEHYIIAALGEIFRLKIELNKGRGGDLDNRIQNWETLRKLDQLKLAKDLIVIIREEAVFQTSIREQFMNNLLRLSILTLNGRQNKKNLESILDKLKSDAFLECPEACLKLADKLDASLSSTRSLNSFLEEVKILTAVKRPTQYPSLFVDYI
jgi:hypothetical protein